MAHLRDGTSFIPKEVYGSFCDWIRSCCFFIVDVSGFEVHCEWLWS